MREQNLICGDRSRIYAKGNPTRGGLIAVSLEMKELLIDILDELRRATRDAIETGNREGSSLPVKLERRIYETLEKVEGKKA